MSKSQLYSFLSAKRPGENMRMLWMGRSKTFNRSVHLIAAQDISSVSIPDKGPQECFVCFVTLDSVPVTTARVYEFADRLLQAGCAYICVWGPDCERWHDIIDEAAAYLDASASAPKAVMTTWHSGESMADALFYFFTCTVPDDNFSTCESALILCPPALVPELSAIAHQWLDSTISHGS
jgi:hypothetical protein